MNFFLSPNGIADYAAWLGALPPRTCLTVHWLAEIGVLPEPGLRIRDKALRFSSKTQLLEMMIVRGNEEYSRRSAEMIENGDLDIYVAWSLWLRYIECVPRQFELPGSRARVLAWVRAKLRRPELTDTETEVELMWQANRLQQEYGESDFDLSELD